MPLSRCPKTALPSPDAKKGRKNFGWSALVLSSLIFTGFQAIFLSVFFFPDKEGVWGQGKGWGAENIVKRDTKG